MWVNRRRSKRRDVEGGDSGLGGDGSRVGNWGGREPGFEQHKLPVTL